LSFTTETTADSMASLIPAAVMTRRMYSETPRMIRSMAIAAATAAGAMLPSCPVRSLLKL
jgi:hypothetical protein